MTENQRNIDERFVHHAADQAPIAMARAFSCAFSGILYALRTQRNFKVHAAFALAAVVLGFALRIPRWSWLAVVACIAAVIALEVMNTAVEAVVDMVSPEWNELAMRAKDCAAGAVYVAALGSLAIAAIVYIPPVIELVSAWI